MNRLTRNEAHLVLAAIRVLDHLQERPPTPGEIAELLQEDESTIRSRLAQLHDLGAAVLLDSAFATRAEIKNHQLVDDLTEEDGPSISEDLAEFDRKKEDEARRMSHLFDSGEHEEKRRRKLEEMDGELEKFRREKPANPFGED